VRSADGTITSFDVPGADRGTIPEIINSSGEIMGEYINSEGNAGSDAFHGFLRKPCK
jgi:hypothetical protein